MARLLLLCLVLCCSLANTSAARRLLMSPDITTSDLSALASAPSPSTPENGRDITPKAPSSSGVGSRGAAAASPSSTESQKNGEVATASRAEEASELGQQGEGHRPSTNPVGGDVIIGGLATAFLAAIVCYIRVTRRRDDEEVQEKV